MTFKRVVGSKYSPDTKIQIVLGGLRPNSIGKTCRKWGISSVLYYHWLQEILEGVTLYVKKNYATSKHPMIENFRKNLLNGHLLTNKILEWENKELDAHLRLIRPIKKGWAYSQEERIELVKRIRTSKLNLRQISDCLCLERATIRRWKKIYKNGRVRLKPEPVTKVDDPKYSDAIFTLLHSPPRSHGINRNTWRLNDLRIRLEKQRVFVCEDVISKIIRKAGYKFSRASKVLTSYDSRYTEKLRKIHNILKNLRQDEAFFSIDEFGPFSVKKRVGRSLTLGETKVVPEKQKIKGKVTLMAGLELATNQITYVFGRKPCSDLTVSLIEKLRAKYRKMKNIYFSWDAAKYHLSKDVNSKIEFLNLQSSGPKIIVAPLPASAQFLNVIESVFGGLYRTVLANSDYPTREKWISAIERYIIDRNAFYKKNPKKAGDKIWTGELTKPKFSLGNNCVETSKWGGGRYKVLQ